MKLERISYLPPEGTHTGKITAANIHQDIKNGQIRESLRLTIALDSTGENRLTKFMARTDYWGSQMNRLYEDLHRLIGDEVNDLVDEEGNIVEEELSLLIGKRVTFQIVHETRPGYEQAFRKVTNLRPLVMAPVRPNVIRFKRAA